MPGAHKDSALAGLGVWRAFGRPSLVIHAPKRPGGPVRPTDRKGQRRSGAKARPDGDRVAMVRVRGAPRVIDLRQPSVSGC